MTFVQFFVYTIVLNASKYVRYDINIVIIKKNWVTVASSSSETRRVLSEIASVIYEQAVMI